MASNNKTKQKSPFPLPKKKKNTSYKKYISMVWLAFFISVIGITGLFFGVSQGLLGEIPDVTELENPNIYVASEIYSADDQLLGRFEKEKSKPVTYSELPNYLVYALLAKEDERFKEHSGVDLQAVARAVAFGGQRGGGSTISQQLAKLLFTDQVSKNKFERAVQKLKEWVVAVSLERIYTKEEIIALYFNKFDFLYNANGIEMASRVYFNKHTSELTLPEAATFVAMLENPIKNNPKRNPEKAKERRNVVLQMMVKNNYLDQANYEKAIAAPVKVDYQRINSVDEGYSSYYKYYLKHEVQEYLDKYEQKTGKKLNLYKDGLKIFTTLDSRMQKYAEEAMKEHLTDLQRRFDRQQRGRRKAPFYKVSDKTINNIMMAAVKRTRRYQYQKNNGVPEDSIMMDFHTPTKLTRFTWNGPEEVEMTPWDSIRYHKQIAQSGLMSMSPSTGEIKAWVGGIDWDHFKYDHIKQGKRQVGSTFKPFVYATAIMKLGMNPCTTISNATYNKKGWLVKGRGGSVQMKDGLAHSLNPVAARLIDQSGTDNVISLARDLGVTQDLPRNNTIALGSSDITIYEMLGAYSTFANYGNYVKPEMIWRIEDPNGRVIKEVKPQYKEVMHESYAYTMIEMMKGVAQYGTASGELRRKGISKDVQIACKTGTTQNNSDGWFMGITPKLATGTWVGWEDRAVHFLSTGEGQGAKMALPIWAIFMKKVWANKDIDISPDDKFVEPSDWKGACGELQGDSSGYGDEGGLITIDQIINPEPKAPKPKSKPKQVEDINAKLNTEDDIDFNQE